MRDNATNRPRQRGPAPSGAVLHLAFRLSFLPLSTEHLPLTASCTYPFSPCAGGKRSHSNPGRGDLLACTQRRVREGGVLAFTPPFGRAPPGSILGHVRPQLVVQFKGQAPVSGFIDGTVLGQTVRFSWSRPLAWTSKGVQHSHVPYRPRRHPPTAI